MKNYQISNLALKHLVEENQCLVNGFINKIQTTPEGLLKLKIHTKKGDKTILVNDKAFYISEESIGAKQNPGGFSAFLKKHLFNQLIKKIEQKGLDRIILFYFPEKILILELFAKGNIILCDNELNILKAMRKEQWKDRTLAQNEKYKFPSSRGANILKITEKEFEKAMKTNEKTAFGATLDILNVAPRIIEVVFEETKIDKKKNANKLSIQEIKKIFTSTFEKYSKKEEKVGLLDNVLYSIDVGNEKEFDSLNEALNTLERSEKPKIVEEKKKEYKIDYEKEIKNSEMKSEKYKKIGSDIYLKYTDLTEILKEINENEKKGLNAKEIMKKINSSKIVVKSIDLTKGKVILEI